MTDENFAAGDEPLHIGGFDIVCVEQVSARPHHRGGAVAEAAEFVPLKLGRMLEMILAVINVALARPALEKNRNRQQLLSFLNGAQQARRRNFADVPLTMQILVMALAGSREVRIDVELVACDADLAVDQGAAAWMIWQAQGNSRFSGHQNFLSLFTETRVPTSSNRFRKTFRTTGTAGTIGTIVVYRAPPKISR